MIKSNVKAMITMHFISFCVVLLYASFYKPQYTSIAGIISEILHLRLQSIPFIVAVVAFGIVSIMLIASVVLIINAHFMKFLSVYSTWCCEKYVENHSEYIEDLDARYKYVLLIYSITILPILIALMFK